MEEMEDIEQFEEIEEKDKIDNDPFSKWSNGDAKCLITLYEEHENDFDREQKIKVWEKITQQICEIRGKNIAVEQCIGKWKGLKAQYKKIKKNSNKSKAKHWQHFERLDRIFSSSSSTSYIEESILPFDKPSLRLFSKEIEETNNAIEFDSFSKWGNGDIKCLIKLYEEHKCDFDSGQKKSKVWEDIARELSILRSKNITPEKCYGKWKGLKVQYKKIKDYNRAYGENSKDWEHYEQLDKLLSNSEINHTDVSYNYGLDVKNYDTKPEMYDFANADENSNSRSDSSRRGKKRKAEVEDAVAQRHKEKMQRYDRFLDLMTRLVDHFTAPSTH